MTEGSPALHVRVHSDERIAFLCLLGQEHVSICTSPPLCCPQPINKTKESQPNACANVFPPSSSLFVSPSRVSKNLNTDRVSW